MSERSEEVHGKGHVSVDPEIEWYYNKGGEASRLEDRYKLEAIRTRRLIEAQLAHGTLDIVDIGGAAGAYAFWLAEKGHAVHLVDPIPLHLDQAREAALQSGIDLAGMYLTHAKALPFEDASFDAALFMGPLYHLVERDARIQALKECKRVLRPGSRIFAVAISRYGTVVEGFFKHYITLPRYADMMRDAARTGQHHNPNRQRGFFTTAYFHKPEELRNELEASGFEDVALRAIEGPWSCIPDFEQKWKDAAFRELLLETIDLMAADPSVLGFGGHIMAIGRAT